MSTHKQTAEGVLVSLSIKLERLMMDVEQLAHRAEKANEEFKWFVEHLPELLEAQAPWRGVYPDFCSNPETCRGYGHCPRDPSCIE